MIAALFVDTGGIYFDMRNVDPWDEIRDARLYKGPHAVVAHPPCERWGRYWSGGPNCNTRKQKGADGGCFLSALNAVRRWGGVLEHPEASHAWSRYELARPPKSGEWIKADNKGGWTCCVEQGHYGHLARKATWLYANRTRLPQLIWGPAVGRIRFEEGPRSKEAALRMRAAPGYKARQRLSASERTATPLLFCKVLLAMARSVK